MSFEKTSIFSENNVNDLQKSNVEQCFEYTGQKNSRIEFNNFIYVIDEKSDNVEIIGYIGDTLDYKVLEIPSFVTKLAPYMFSELSGDAKIIHKDNRIKNMREVFCKARKVNSLDLSEFDTHGVEYMSNMFEDCWSLVSIDLSNFNIEKVIDMSSMFENCYSLTKLDLAHTVNRKIKSMSAMFKDCVELRELDLGNFYITDRTYVRDIFKNCGIIEHLEYCNIPYILLSRLGL